MLKTNLFVFLFIPQLSYANFCNQIFKPNTGNATLNYTNQLIDEINLEPSVSKESLYHLVDLVTSGKSDFNLKIKAQKALGSLKERHRFDLRMKSYELLTSSFKSDINFFEFFKTKEDIAKFLVHRQHSFEQQNYYPTAVELLSVFNNYRVGMPIRLEQYLETFDRNGYFYIQKAELEAILSRSPSIYAQLLSSLTRIDSRVHPNVLYSLLKSNKLIENYEVAFKPTLNAIEQQGIKIKTTDFKFFLENTDLNTKQSLILSDLLSYLSRHSEAYLNQFAGEGGFLINLLGKINLSTPFGRILYQQVFLTLRDLKYEMTQEELQLSLSVLMSYKPMPFDTQTRLTGLLRFEFESPVEIFHDYVVSANKLLQWSQKNYAFQVLNQNLSASPHEKVYVEKLKAFIE